MVSAPPICPSTGPVASAVYGQRLLSAMDSVPDTRNLGADRSWTVPCCGRHNQPFIVVQLRPSTYAKARPAAEPDHISLGKEWLNLGLDLGGAALS